MNPLVPYKRKVFIKKLINLGFEGPYSGSKHQFMIYENHRIAIPSNKEFSIVSNSLKIENLSLEYRTRFKNCKLEII